jgi:hypothetical protein
MHFTVVFDSHESHDLSYGMVFTPCAAWIEGERTIAIPHPHYPNYKRGDLKVLLEATQLEQRLASGSRSATVVVHEAGHGSDDDLRNLHDDLTAAGFEVSEVRASPARSVASTIDELQRLRRVLAGSQLPRSEREWRGAGVIVTASARSDGGDAGASPDIIVLTEHSRELSWLVEQLRDAFYAEDRVDFDSKYAFFRRLAEAANGSLKADPRASANDLCSAVLQEAFTIYDEMEQGTFA